MRMIIIDLYRLAKMSEEEDSEFEAWYGMAEASLSMGKKEEAIEEFLKLGALCEQNNDLLNAYRVYKKVIEIDPLNMNALNKVGVLYSQIEQEEDSKKEGKKKKKEKKKKKKK